MVRSGPQVLSGLTLMLVCSLWSTERSRSSVPCLEQFFWHRLIVDEVKAHVSLTLCC